MRTVYLLINNQPLIPYTDKWRVFDTLDLCVVEAKKQGFSGMLPPTGKVGVLTHEKSGDVDVGVIAIEVEETAP